MVNKQEEIDKAIGQFKLRLNPVLEPLKVYGQEPFVKGAINQITMLAQVMAYQLSGVPLPDNLLKELKKFVISVESRKD